MRPRNSGAWRIAKSNRGFFDRMSHEWAMRFVPHRIAGTGILGRVQKGWPETAAGASQGAVSSPWPANV